MGGWWPFTQFALAALRQAQRGHGARGAVGCDLEAEEGLLIEVKLVALELRDRVRVSPWVGTPASLLFPTQWGAWRAPP
jgi:hypothetical protein